jgi:hypothetical protein
VEHLPLLEVRADANRKVGQAIESSVVFHGRDDIDTEMSRPRHVTVGPPS